MAGASEIQPIQVTLRKLGNAFTLWGRVSLWIKSILNLLALLSVIIAVLAPSERGVQSIPQPPVNGAPIPTETLTTNAGIGLFLVICGVVILSISTFWSYRYINWGKRLTNTPMEEAPSKGSTVDLLKIGLGIDLFGMILTLMGGESIGGQVLVRSLFQFEAAFTIRVGPLDLAPLLACIHVALGLYIGIGLSLYLLQRTTQPQ